MLFSDLTLAIEGGWMRWIRGYSYPVLPGQSAIQANQVINPIFVDAGLKRYFDVGRFRPYVRGALGFLLPSAADDRSLGPLFQAGAGVLLNIGKPRAAFEIRYGAYGVAARSVRFNQFGNAEVDHPSTLYGALTFAVVVSL